MKLAASNIAWQPGQDAEVAALLRRHGFGAIEIALTRDWPDLAAARVEDVRAFAERWRGEGLPIVAAQALLFGKPDLRLFGPPEIARQTIDYLRRVFDLCAAAGARTMVFGSPRNRRSEGRSRADLYALAESVFHELGEEAGQRDLVVAIEPNPPEYGGDFVTTAGEAIHLVHAVDHPAFRLHLDFGCLLMTGGVTDDSIAAALPYLAHAHASAPHLAPVHTSAPTLPDFFSALQRAGYDGWVSLEMRIDESGLSALEQSLQYVRAIESRHRHQFPK